MRRFISIFILISLFSTQTFASSGKATREQEAEAVVKMMLFPLLLFVPSKDVKKKVKIRKPASSKEKTKTKKQP